MAVRGEEEGARMGERVDEDGVDGGRGHVDEDDYLYPQGID